jgi:ferredoxin
LYKIKLFLGEGALYSKILVLRYAQEHVSKPIVCGLVKTFDLDFNILKAKILPRKEGILVLELSGQRKNLREGLKHLKHQGIDVTSADQEVKRDNQRCTHCGACTAVCTTGALTIQRPEMAVNFNQEKCSVCELCVTACPVRAMQVRPSTHIFFE